MALLIFVAILACAGASGLAVCRLMKGRTNALTLCCLASFSATVAIGAVLTLAVTSTGIV